MARALLGVGLVGAALAAKPNIILIVADDLGFRDVGFSGSNISTPNIDRFASEGVRLSEYRGQPVCSPSRAALHTGRYPIAYGLQTYVIDPPGVDYGLNLNETTLPELLKQYGGYSTAAIGKWHLGMAAWAYTPTFRGYLSFTGFYSGGQDYFTHQESNGFDLHRDVGANCGEGCSVVDWANAGRFSTELYASAAIDVIQSHDQSAGPLFLYAAFQAVHSPDEVPQSYIDPYNSTIPSLERRTFAGMLSALDEGIGNITRALDAAGMADNTLIFFVADNGGPISCADNICGDHTGSTNYPLRGGKHSLFEGGTRVTAAAWGKMLSNTGVNRTGLMHHVDILPTCLEAAGIPVSSLPAGATLPLHGLSQWAMVSTGAPSTRSEVLLNIDPLQPVGAAHGNAGLILGDWKILVGETGPPWGVMPEEEQAAWDEGFLSLAAGGVATYTPFSRSSPSSSPSTTTTSAATKEGGPTAAQRDLALALAAAGAPPPALWPLNNMTIQLFNIASDPYERDDVSAANPAIVAQLLARVEYWATQVQVLPLFWNATVNPRSNPKLHNGSWVPWL